MRTLSENGIELTKWQQWAHVSIRPSGNDRDQFCCDVEFRVGGSQKIRLNTVKQSGMPPGEPKKSKFQRNMSWLVEIINLLKRNNVQPSEFRGLYQRHQ